MAEEQSGYRIYSLGHAAEAKEEGMDWELEVIPMEITQLSDGAQTNRGINLETKGIDAAGNEYADKTISSGSMNATWFGQGESNRRTCPNVFAGEELILYTYNDTGKLWWTPRNTNSNGRTVETVTLAFAADPSGNSETVRTADNSYQIDVSGHRKVLTISTSMKNGETNTFTLQLNGGEGYATLQDDTGQEVTLNPQENRISLINNQDVEVHLIGNDLQVKVPGDETHDIQGNLTINVAGNATVAAKGNVDVTAGGKANITSTLNTLNGPTAINGTLTVSGASTLTGGASSPMPITAPNIK